MDQLLVILGHSATSRVGKWLRAFKQLPAEVQAKLDKFHNVPQTYVLDSQFLMGTGFHARPKPKASCLLCVDGDGFGAEVQLLRPFWLKFLCSKAASMHSSPKASDVPKRQTIDPGEIYSAEKLTWNLKTGPLKRRVVYEGPMLRFHASFSGL